MLSDRLWKKNDDLVQACLNHSFVVDLGRGSLDANAFKRYVAQDAFFLRAFFQAYAVAAAKSASFERMKAYHQFMGGVLEELKLHGDYSTHLGIDLHNVDPYTETLAYTEFLKRAAWHDSEGVIVAAMTPCMKLYAFLGSELKHQNHPNHPYKRWIDTYSDPEFQSLSIEVEALLNSAASEDEADSAYRYALQCEYDFFSAPLEERA